MDLVSPRLTLGAYTKENDRRGGQGGWVGGDMRKRVHYLHTAIIDLPYQVVSICF